MKTFSPAAIDWAATHPCAWSASGYDAGHAAALATVAPVQPRVLTTAAELDALPKGSIVIDSVGDPWRKSGSFWKYGNSVRDSSQELARSYPDGLRLTLLAPVPATTEPVRLTDPDDPHLFDGSLIEVRTVSSAWSPAYLTGCLRDEKSAVYLIEEAPVDPDAEMRQAIADLLNDECGLDTTDGDIASLLRSLNHLGYEITKAAK